MAASVLVDLARSTTHSLAQHFRSYLHRNSGVPCSGMVRPRGVLFRGVATNATGGLRARNNGHQGEGGVERRPQDKSKKAAEQELGKYVKGSASTSTTVSTCSTASISSTASSSSSLSNKSLKDSAILRQVRKGKRWLSKTSHKLTVDPPKDNQKIKAAALEGRRPVNDFRKVGLNNIMSSGGDKKNILGFDARRILRPGGVRAKAEVGLVAGSGQPPHVFMTRYQEINNTYETDRDRDAVLDLIKRMYGDEYDIGEAKAREAKKAGGVNSETRKKRKRKSKKKKSDIAESSKKPGGSLISRKMKEETDAIVQLCLNKEAKKAKLLKVVNQLKSPPVLGCMTKAEAMQLRSKSKHKKHVSESDAPKVQRPRYEDMRKTTSNESINNKFVNRNVATSVLSSFDLKEPTVANGRKKTPQKKDATCWTEMKEQPEVYATDIQKRLELYTTQYVSGTMKKLRSNKADGEVRNKEINESTKTTGNTKQTQTANISDVNGLNKNQPTKTALVTELVAVLKSQDMKNAEKNRVKVVPEIRSGLEPELTITREDMEPRVKAQPDVTKPEKVNCGPCLKPPYKPKPKPKPNKDLEGVLTAKYTSNVPSSSIYPPYTDTFMWSKILINRMEKVKEAAGIPMEKPSTDLDKVVDNVLKTSSVRVEEEVVRTDGDKEVKVIKAADQIDAQSEEKGSEVLEVKSPKVLSKRDKQLIDEIKKQWTEKFKSKFNQMMKHRSSKSSEQNLLPSEAGSDTEVFRTALSSVKPSPSPMRNANKAESQKEMDAFKVDDVIYIGPSSDPIRQMTESDLTYWESINCSSDVTACSIRPTSQDIHSDVKSGDLDQNKALGAKEILPRESESREKTEFIRDMLKTYTRSEMSDSAKPRKELSAKLKKTKSKKKADFDPNAKGDYSPSMKKSEREKRQKTKAINYLKNLPTLRGVGGGNSLQGMMEMKLIPEEDGTEMKLDINNQKSETGKHDKSGSGNPSRQMISDIQALLNDGDKLSKALARQREAEIENTRRQLITSYRKNIRKHQRVLDSYKGKLLKLKLLDEEHRWAKDKHNMNNPVKNSDL